MITRHLGVVCKQCNRLLSINNKKYYCDCGNVAIKYLNKTSNKSIVVFVDDFKTIFFVRLYKNGYVVGSKNNKIANVREVIEPNYKLTGAYMNWYYPSTPYTLWIEKVLFNKKVSWINVIKRVVKKEYWNSIFQTLKDNRYATYKKLGLDFIKTNKSITKNGKIKFIDFYRMSCYKFHDHSLYQISKERLGNSSFSIIKSLGFHKKL